MTSKSRHIKSIVTIICLLVLFGTVKASDTLKLKRNNFVVKLSNAALLRKYESFHYRNKIDEFNATQYDGMVYDKSSYWNPKIVLGFEHALRSSLPNKNKWQHWFSFMIETGISDLTYSNTYIGSISSTGGGIYAILREKDTYQFLNLKSGVKLNYKNYKNTIYSLSFAASGAHLLFETKEVDFLDNVSGAVTHHAKHTFNNPYQVITKSDYFSIDIGLSIGKKVKQGQVGVFIDYSIPNYTLFNMYFWIYRSSFLKNFNCIYYGLYYNF